MSTKICNVCKKEKSLEMFFKKGKGRQYRCKECLKDHKTKFYYDSCECGLKKLKTSSKCSSCSKIDKKEIFPKDFIDEVISMYRSGLSTWKIARNKNTNQTRIRRILNREGILLRENEYWKSGKKREENPRWTGFGEISGGLWGSIERSASQRGLKFDISIQDVWDLYLLQEGKCALSGLDLCLPQSDEERITGFTTASLDRIDSTKGYSKDNIQWVHKFINRMKSNYTEEEFLYLSFLVYKKNKDRIDKNKQVELKTLSQTYRKNKDE